MDTHPVRYPYLVRMYVQHLRPHTSGKPTVWGEPWIQGTIAFGKTLILVGVGLLVGCIFLPEDGRRWLCVAFGVIVSSVGYWHVRNARNICAMGVEQQ